MSQISADRSRQVAEQARQDGWALPSFARELFLGRVRPGLIHPFPRPSDQDRAKGDAFLRRLSDFLAAEVDPMEIEEDARVPDAVVRGLAALGAFGMNISEEYGGQGLSHVYYNRALVLVN